MYKRQGQFCDTLCPEPLACPCGIECIDSPWAEQLQKSVRALSQHSLQKLVEVSLFVPKKFINIFFWQFLRVNNLYQVWNSDNTLFLQGELSNGVLTCLERLSTHNLRFCNVIKIASKILDQCRFMKLLAWMWLELTKKTFVSLKLQCWSWFVTYFPLFHFNCYKIVISYRFFQNHFSFVYIFRNFCV